MHSKKKSFLYPIVDSAEWIQTLLPLGIKTIQLRIKNKVSEALEDEIKRAVQLSHRYAARLFINDYWELAIQQGAYGVHLGQEDLFTADLKKISDAGLQLGISTHSDEELKNANGLQPSYIALGPIFPTNTKSMKCAPQGLAKLKAYLSIVNYPLVAIGGINLENLSDVIATGVDGIAMISAITQARDPIVAVGEALRTIHSGK